MSFIPAVVSSLKLMVSLVVGAVGLLVGLGTYRGRGRIVRRLPGLTDSQQSLVMIAAGAIFFLRGVITLI